jgi:excisionase family DNA binding protein
VTEKKPKTWTPEELADLLQISPRTLRRLISSGDIPQPIRYGRAARWSDELVETILNPERRRPGVN